MLMPGLHRTGAAVARIETQLETGQKLVVLQAVQVLHHAVVVQDLHLVVGEYDGGEEIPGFLTRAGRPCLTAQLLHALGGGRTVMTVGHIQTLHLVEGFLDTPDRLVVLHHPQHMAIAIVCHKIVLGHLRDNACDQGVDLGPGTVSQKHRPHLRVEGVDVIDAVVLLVRTRELVLLDQVGFVRRDGRRRHQADLRVLAHHLLVDVERGTGVAPQNAAFDEALQVLGTTLVDAHVIGIHGRVHVDLGLVDAQKAVLIASGHGEGFVPVQHIVRGHGDPCGQLWKGAQCIEWFDQLHDVSL